MVPPKWIGHGLPRVPYPDGRWGAVDFFRKAYPNLRPGDYGSDANWTHGNVRAAHGGVAKFADAAECKDEDGNVIPNQVITTVHVTDDFFGIKTVYTHLRYPPDVEQQLKKPGVSEIRRIVNAGDVIGILRKDHERDCREADPHLHLGIYRDGDGDGKYEKTEGVDLRNVRFDGQVVFKGTEVPRLFEKNDRPWRRFYWGDPITSSPAPSTVRRRGDVTGGPVSQTAIAYLGKYGHPNSTSRVVTAVRTGEGNLKLIVWDIPPGGKIVRKGEAQAGAATEIAMDVSGPHDITGTSTSLVATAVRDGSGRLKIVTWHVKGDGRVERKGDATGEAVSKVAIVKKSGWAPASRFVTAIRTNAGNLKLIVWDVTYADGSITRKGEIDAGPITDVTMTHLANTGIGGAIGYLVTAVRLDNGNLKLIVWDVTAGGQIVRKGDILAGAVTDITIAPLPPSRTEVRAITAVRLSSGNLKLITWKISAAGAIERGMDISAGAISDVALDTAGSLALTTVRLNVGDELRDNLRVVEWNVSSTGAIRRGDDSLAGDASKISVTSLGATASFVTALRDRSGNLKLIVWDVY